MTGSGGIEPAAGRQSADQIGVDQLGEVPSRPVVLHDLTSARPKGNPPILPC